MSAALTAGMIALILKETAAEWGRHMDELGQLDAGIGDGDLGVTVELASKALADYLSKKPVEDDIGKLLLKCGMEVNRASPSTFGTLLACAFMEAGKAVLGRREIGIQDLLRMGQGAVEGIRKRGRAEVGGKTMLDALVPAVEAFQRALAEGAHLEKGMKSAVEAAETGMEATLHMRAKHGRASYRPDGGVGAKDAGAVATYYFLELAGKRFVEEFVGSAANQITG